MPGDSVGGSPQSATQRSRQELARSSGHDQAASTHQGPRREGERVRGMPRPGGKQVQSSEFQRQEENQRMLPGSCRESKGHRLRGGAPWTPTAQPGHTRVQSRSHKCPPQKPPVLPWSGNCAQAHMPLDSSH